MFCRSIASSRIAPIAMTIVSRIQYVRVGCVAELSILADASNDRAGGSTLIARLTPP
jgi:hypothetical protein